MRRSSLCARALSPAGYSHAPHHWVGGARCGGTSARSGPAGIGRLPIVRSAGSSARLMRRRRLVHRISPRRPTSPRSLRRRGRRRWCALRSPYQLRLARLGFWPEHSWWQAASRAALASRWQAAPRRLAQRYHLFTVLPCHASAGAADRAFDDQRPAYVCPWHNERSFPADDSGAGRGTFHVLDAASEAVAARASDRSRAGFGNCTTHSPAELVATLSEGCSGCGGRPLRGCPRRAHLIGVIRAMRVDARRRVQKRKGAQEGLGEVEKARCVWVRVGCEGRVIDESPVVVATFTVTTAASCEAVAVALTGGATPTPAAAAVPTAPRTFRGATAAICAYFTAAVGTVAAQSGGVCARPAALAVPASAHRCAPPLARCAPTCREWLRTPHACRWAEAVDLKSNTTGTMHPTRRDAPIAGVGTRTRPVEADASGGEAAGEVEQKGEAEGVGAMLITDAPGRWLEPDSWREGQRDTAPSYASPTAADSSSSASSGRRCACGLRSIGLRPRTTAQSPRRSGSNGGEGVRERMELNAPLVCSPSGLAVCTTH
eukprot:scaffold167677_cov30-Tisochrysis_lutea.AAC.6